MRQRRPTGSATANITTGIVLVAFFTARISGVPLTSIRFTLRRINSETSSGKRSLRPPVYKWLKRNAPAHGFIRTVNKEPWHWEYDRAKAATAMATHTYKTGNVTV
jgi:hypothetical protein